MGSTAELGKQILQLEDIFLGKKIIKMVKKAILIDSSKKSREENTQKLLKILINNHSSYKSEAYLQLIRYHKIYKTIEIC